MSFDVENFRLLAALSYAAKGWQVIPLHYPKIGYATEPRCSCGKADCPSLGKHPMTKNGLKDASRDEAVLRGWWGKWPAANVGILTGSDSAGIVIDVDKDKGGFASLADLCDTHGQLPETVEANTGGGGLHLFFKHPGGALGNSAEKLGPGLDVRGDGGYVVGSPSQHRSGRRYEWREGQSPVERDAVPMPEWMLAILRPPIAPKQPAFNGRPVSDSIARHLLGKALAKVGPEPRNHTGHWLACQLRDNRIPLGEAESIMREYASRCPAGEHPYTVDEAMATVRSCYNTPAREPWAAKERPSPKPTKPAAPPAVPTQGAAAELRDHMRSITSRQVVAVPLPWDTVSRLTFALLPGTVTCIVGDPGVGKTFLVLQGLLFWLADGYDPAAFFIEKNRQFHTQRLLAQLEADGRYMDWDWLPENGQVVEEAMARHELIVDAVGQCIYSAPLERVTLDSLIAWVREQAVAGKRVIVVDPITAVSAGSDRWTKDEDFMIEAQAIATEYKTSLIFVTHAKKGNRPGASSGHDMAGGAAYHRFSDTTIWVARPTKPRKVQYQTKYGPSSGVIPIFFQLHKTRNGRGGGLEVAFTFDKMKFVEQGVVLKELRSGNDTEAA